MSETQRSFTKTFKVSSHHKNYQAEKEPVFSVTLKTDSLKKADTAMTLKVESTLESILERFPLNAPIEVRFTNPQTQLETE